MSRLNRYLNNPVALGGVTILLTLLAFLLWAMAAPVSGAIVAMGMVKTELNRKVVQHPEGGIIKTILVKEGETVAAGQPLIELDSVSTDANYQLARELAAIETVKRERLDAERQLALRFVLTEAMKIDLDSDSVKAAYPRELKVFTARRTSLDQQLATLAEQLKAIEQERRALMAQIQADKDGVRLAKDELAMNRTLEEKQFVAKARVIAVERAMTDYQSKLGEHEATLAQAEQRANDIKLRMASLRNDYQRAASEEYTESNSRLVELLQRLRPAEDAMQRKIIPAPVAGKVVGLKFYAPGQVAGPREPLMEIVPNEESLLLEAQVSVDGIKELHINQLAEIKFTAFKSRTTPVVSGKLTYVSPDALTDKNGAPFYQIRVQPEAESMRAAGISQLQPGMAAEIYVLTEARTVVDYLLSPITDTLRRSMRER